MPTSTALLRRFALVSAGAVAAAAVCAAPATASGAGTAGAAAPPLTCSEHTLAVRLLDPGPATQTLSGTLCHPGRNAPDTVQLLVHGATYNRSYWDFPYGGGYYSYVRAATAAGYATFDVDRIGAGSSSHPDSSQVTVAAGAVALHDAITALRSGAVGGHQFRHVIWVGHSFGSIHAWVEIARYHDVDALVITGALHRTNSAVLAQANALTYPAVLDPRFAGSGLDLGYLTTLPGARATLFYHPATADPAVVAVDEATKDTATAAQLGDGLPLALGQPPDLAPSRLIDVPVLVVTGQDDALFCGGDAADCSDPAAVRNQEAPYYPLARQLRIALIPGTGHDLALSTTAPLTDAVTLAWARSVQPPH
jgi:hypothetical protein